MIKFKNKIADIEELRQKIKSGDVKVINLLGKNYILDVEEKDRSVQIRIYPPEFTYRGRNDGYMQITEDSSIKEVLYYFA